MKVAIIGYGKMGRMIEGILLERGHEVVVTIDQDNIGDFASEAFASCDVAIEFTRPEAAVDNILRSFAAKVPVVSGTTGWTSSMPEIRALCEKGEGSLLWASNFSIGVNIFMALNRYLADVMGSFPQYHPEMTEVHHIHKLDHPSGTAITLAEELIAHSPAIDSWREPAEGEALPAGVLPIHALREGEVPGIHTITWESEADAITISHSAHTRRGFAMGAVMAAEWLAGKQGFHTMAEMLSDYTHTEGLFV
ncbi:MAG: 4-hydroxy-tetrahydrodipicolinate reductase [Muribaculaceae bacterium]|nr:4-hydroxy-tetrahydrodipicolinate reductase [Muribaculaceae bacterium]